MSPESVTRVEPPYDVLLLPVVIVIVEPPVIALPIAFALVALSIV